MSAVHASVSHIVPVPQGMQMADAGTLERVMEVLKGIRAMQSSGIAYDGNSNLTDAGFTSVEMVKVMLGVEAEFDVMIPQEMISPRTSRRRCPSPS